MTEVEQAQHTPGPWVVQSDDTGPTIMLDSGLVLAELPGTTEAKANARLIAAAPELLDALRDIAEGNVPDDLLALDVHTFRSEWIALIQKRARAAIAKATGGQS